MSTPNPDYQSLFGRAGGQGRQFDVALAPDGKYYGFLSKADFDEETKLWDVFFELVNKRFMDNAIFNPTTSVPAPAPAMPALAYHVVGASESALLAALSLKSTDDLAEGSWYELALAPGSGTIAGELYDPDIDTTGVRPA